MKRITVKFGPECKLVPTVPGQFFRHPDGTVEAWFDLDKDAEALLIAEKLRVALQEEEEEAPSFGKN